MKNLLYVVYVSCLISSTVGQLEEIISNIKNATDACGLQQVGTQVESCIRNASLTWEEGAARFDWTIQVMQSVSGCLQRHTTHFLICGNANIIAMLETIRILAENNGKLIRSMEPFLAPSGNSGMRPCTREQEKSAPTTVRECLRENDVPDHITELFTSKFCSNFAGVRDCYQELYKMVSDWECALTEHASTMLEVISKIESGIENSIGSTSCLISSVDMASNNSAVDENDNNKKYQLIFPASFSVDRANTSTVYNIYVNISGPTTILFG